MPDEEKTVAEEAMENPKVLDPDQVQIPEEVARRLSPDMLIDASRVLMMVGDEREARPMTIPQIMQEMFGIIGDLDKRLMALEDPSRRPSGLILPN
jgi:hypothetical protein